MTCFLEFPSPEELQLSGCLRFFVLFFPFVFFLFLFFLFFFSFFFVCSVIAATWVLLVRVFV